MRKSYHNIEIREDSITGDGKAESWVKEMRGAIMVVAVLVAGATYTAGLNPPGGFWQDDTDNWHKAGHAPVHHEADNATSGHIAGNAVLHDEYYNRYITFFYANATAFMASLVIIILLTNEKFSSHVYKVFLLEIIMVLDLVSLMIAYAAGCARSVRTSIYVFVLAVAVLLFVVLSAGKLQYFCSTIRHRLPDCMSPPGNGNNLEGEKHGPSPANDV